MYPWLERAPLGRNPPHRQFLTDDLVAQTVTYQRVTLGGRAPRCGRYGCATAGRANFDLMVRLAGLRLREHYQDWDRGPFTGESQDHISVYEVTAAPGG
jgi:hypothetical protein